MNSRRTALERASCRENRKLGLDFDGHGQLRREASHEIDRNPVIERGGGGTLPRR
jgi:hypothetical protein